MKKKKKKTESFMHSEQFLSDVLVRLRGVCELQCDDEANVSTLGFDRAATASQLWRKTTVQTV